MGGKKGENGASWDELMLKGESCHGGKSQK